MIFLAYFAFRGQIIFLDSIFFSILFIIINAYRSFKLFIKLIPPSFTSEEKKLYNRYFSKYFKLNEYRKLIDCARRRVYRINSTVTNTGNEFTSIFFIADITASDIMVDLRVFGKSTRLLDNNSWIGIVEYVDLISNKVNSDVMKNEPITWGIDIVIKFNNEESVESKSESESDEDMLSSQDEDVGTKFNLSCSAIQNEVVIYEWDLNVI
jgi:hypothetical protein